MKKRVLTILLSVLICLALAVPAGAAEAVAGQLETAKAVADLLPQAEKDMSGAIRNQISAALDGLPDANAGANAAASLSTSAFANGYVGLENEADGLSLGGFVVGEMNLNGVDAVLILTAYEALAEEDDGRRLTEVYFNVADAANIVVGDGHEVWTDGFASLVAVHAEEVPGNVQRMPLVPLSGLSGTEKAYRVGVTPNNAGNALEWVVTEGNLITSSNYPDGLISMTSAPVVETQVGGPVILENGSVAGVAVVAVVNDKATLEYIMPMDGIIALLESNGASYATGSSGGGSSSGGSSGGGSGSQGGGSGSGGGSQGGGMKDDLISGGLIGLVAAVIAGVFLSLRKKKKDNGSSGGVTPPANFSGGSTPPSNFSGGAPGGFSGGPTAGVNQFPGGATVGFASGGAAIIGRGGLMNGKRFPLQGGGMGLGRDPARCVVVYPSGTPGVSAMHCQLINQGGSWAVMDMGSTYGTFVNGRKLQPSMPCPLRPGDSFYLGQPDNTFVFEGV